MAPDYDGDAGGVGDYRVRGITTTCFLLFARVTTNNMIVKRERGGGEEGEGKKNGRGVDTKSNTN